VRTFSEGGARRAKGIMRPPPPAPPRTRRAERCSSELRANTRESDIFSSSLQSNDEQIVTSPHSLTHSLTYLLTYSSSTEQ
jgi:hypothetical protein